MDDIALLIPAYNEAKTIQQLVNRCSQYSQQIIIVDDGSTDHTSTILKNSSAMIISHEHNQGKGAALLTGFQKAIEKNYRGVIVLDADGQHDPDDLPRFFDIIHHCADTFIIGARWIAKKRAPKIRLLANKLSDFFISCAARKRLHDTQSGYRYYPASFLKKYIQTSAGLNRFAFEADILVAAVRERLPVCYVPIVSCYPDDARASHYHPSKDTWAIAKAITKRMVKTR